MEVIVKSSPKIEIELATKVVKVGGGGKVTIDSALSTTSENPVMNKVITEELRKKAEKTDVVTPDWNAHEGEAGYIDNRTHCIDYKNLTDITVDDEKYELSMVEEDGVYVHYARLKQQLQWYGDNYDIVYKKPLHEYGPDINESDLYYDVIRRVTDDWPSPTPPEFGWDAKLEFVDDEWDGHKELVLRSYGTIRGEKLYISGPYGVPIMQIETHFIPDTIARTNDVDELREETTALWENLDHGTFPDLVAGDLAGRGESVPAEFGFRASGGKSIKDGRAYIKRIKGNSVVWNQLFHKGVNTNGEVWDNNLITINIETTTAYDKYDNNADAKRGSISHKYLQEVVKVSGTVSQGSIKWYSYAFGGFVGIDSNTPNGVIMQKIGSILYDNAYWSYRHYEANTIANGLIVRQIVYDLTQMFGAGNEPTTIEEFNSRVATLGIEDMYAYNEGEVIHCNTESIKSVGDNAWDEQWENGTFDITSGEAIDGSWVMGQIRSKNPLMVLPNEEYYVSMGKASMWAIFLDKEGNAIESPAHNGLTAGNAINVGNGRTFKTPTNAAFLIFYCTEDYGNTYNHDILISLYHSGWKAQKDDQYQPYWQDILPLPIINKYFPDGMKLAGAAHDEIRYNKASGKWEYSKGRIKSVDLGTLTWNMVIADEGYNVFFSDPFIAKYDNEGLNIINEKYTPAIVWINTMKDKQCRLFQSGEGVMLYVRDADYTDAESFKAMLQEKQVKLYYESNDWEWVELDAEDQNFRDYYQVADFGTEEAIPATDAEGNIIPSAAFSADIIYQFNAVDMIREHELEITELQSIIATMQAQLTALTNGGQ